MPRCCISTASSGSGSTQNARASTTAPRSTDDWLMKDIRSPLKIAHSRINALRKGDLAARGYQLLTESQEAGVDIFAKQLRSHFIFFQGHPEYEALSLQREYLRDITRYLVAPARRLSRRSRGLFRRRHRTQARQLPEAGDRRTQIPLSVELPHLDASFRSCAGVAARLRNWLNTSTRQLGSRLSAPNGVPKKQ